MNAPTPVPKLWAVVDPRGVELAWGATPGLAWRSAMNAFGHTRGDLIGDGYTVAPALHQTRAGSDLAVRLDAAIAARTVGERFDDWSLRWLTDRTVFVALGVAAALAVLLAVCT